MSSAVKFKMALKGLRQSPSVRDYHFLLQSSDDLTLCMLGNVSCFDFFFKKSFYIRVSNGLKHILL